MKAARHALAVILGLLAVGQGWAAEPPKARPSKLEFTEGRKHYVLTPLYSDHEKLKLAGFRISTAGGRVIQTIPHEFELTDKVPDYLPMQMVDCDFDGFSDLQLADDGFTGSAGRNQTYTFWVWDDTLGRFVLNKTLAERGIRSIDPKTGYLHAYGSDRGGAWYHEVYEFTRSGHLIPVLSEGTTGREANDAMSYQKTIYKNGKPYREITGPDPREQP